MITKALRHLLYGAIKLSKQKREIACCRLGFPKTDAEMDLGPIPVKGREGEKENLDPSPTCFGQPSWDPRRVGPIRGGPHWVEMTSQAFLPLPIQSLEVGCFERKETWAKWLSAMEADTEGYENYGLLLTAVPPLTSKLYLRKDPGNSSSCVPCQY